MVRLRLSGAKLLCSIHGCERCLTRLGLANMTGAEVNSHAGASPSTVGGETMSESKWGRARLYGYSMNFMIGPVSCLRLEQSIVSQSGLDRYSSQFKNNCFTEM